MLESLIHDIARRLSVIERLLERTRTVENAAGSGGGGAPSAHGSTHQHGGSDQIATATPGANVIPKAGADNKLAYGFMPVGTTSSTVAAGDDSRMTNSRTPTAHASSHAAAGSDPLTLSVSQVTNAVDTADSRLSDARVPTGTAGGDLSGSYPDPVVDAIQGIAVSTTDPTDGQVLQYSSSSGMYVPTAPTLSGTAGGDLTGTYPNPTVDAIRGVGISTVAPNDGEVLTYYGLSGNWVALPSAGGPPTGTAGGDLNGTYPNPTVDGLQGYGVQPGAPSAGDYLQWDNTNTRWDHLPLPTIVSSVSANTPVTSSGGTTPTIGFISGTNNQALVHNGTNWVAGLVSLNAGVTGTLSAANGGLGYAADAQFFAGWIPTVLVYSGASTVYINGQSTVSLSRGDKIKFDQSGTTKYFTVLKTVVSNVGGTDRETITVSSTQGQTVASGAAITNAYYSHAATPLVHPDNTIRTVGSTFPSNLSGGTYPDGTFYHFDTDSNMEYFWNTASGQWLSTTRYAVAWMTRIAAGSGGHSVATTVQDAAPDQQYSMYFERFEVNTFVVTTNSGVSYWTLDFTKVDSGNALRTIASVNTSAGAANVWLPLVDTTMDPLYNPVTTADKQLGLSLTKTGTPGNIYLGVNAYYRYVSA